MTRIGEVGEMVPQKDTEMALEGGSEEVQREAEEIRALLRGGHAKKEGELAQIERQLVALCAVEERRVGAVRKYIADPSLRERLCTEADSQIAAALESLSDLHATADTRRALLRIPEDPFLSLVSSEAAKMEDLISSLR
eukprot:Sspe_Gene.106469::Locus_84548_Transcript_1_1_Confidence_1.000_Length_1852::g.106469::m.106469